IEGNRQRQLELPDDGENRVRIGGGCLDDHRTDIEGDPGARQFGDQLRQRRLAVRGDMAARRKLDDRAVLGDDSVDEVQATRGRAQVFQDPPGYEHHDNALTAHRGNRLTDVRIEPV